MQALAKKSRALGKPIVVFKVGKSEQAQSTTLSHTASLAGSRTATEAFLWRYGFGQAHSISAFLESLKLLHVCGTLEGYRLSSMSCSGGEAAIIADAAVGRKVFFPALDEHQIQPVEAALGPLVTVANPLDYHTYCWGDAEVMNAAYNAMVGNDFDINFLILDFPHRQRCEDWEWHIAVEAFDSALKASGAKGAFVISMPENISEDYTEAFMQKGIVSLYGFDEALQAAEIAADIGSAWRRVESEPLLQLAQPEGAKTTLNEAAAKHKLAGFNVPIPANETVGSVQQALDSASRLGFPLVLKALGVDHKTETDALRMNLRSTSEIAEAATALLELSDQLYVETMVDSVVAELIVGVTRDPQFGLVLSIGSGGILVEIMQDIQTLLVPASRSDIENALVELKSAPLLSGYRGKPKADIEATIEVILAIQDYAIAEADTLVELDVNPLLVCAQGEGVFAVDALIVLQEKQTHV
jgi:acyl-CoA synthetase (NDP forming)